MNLKDMGKLFRGISNFTSANKLRVRLNYAFVPDAHTIEAADGHKLIRLKCPGDGHGLDRGFYDVKKAQALCKAEILPTPETVPLSDGSLPSDWPAFDAIIPKREDGGAAVRALGLDPRYLAEVCDGMIAVLSPWGAISGVRVQMPDDATGPVRLDADLYGEGSAVVVLMPMRI